MKRKMSVTVKASAAFALCASVAGVALVGYSGDSAEAAKPDARTSVGDSFVGTKKIKVDGQNVNVSCSGKAAHGKPVVMLLHGGGDDLTTFKDIQKKVSEKNRVCSYDRLGAGGSDKPEGPQTVTSSGKVLTGVLDQVAGDSPVVLAGHSLGGLLAARYAPEHQDRVHGLVLMDATPSTQTADVKRIVPETATGPAKQLRDEFLAVAGGKNAEKLSFGDTPVRSAGDIPVQVIKHGIEYLAEVPEYGRALEQAWTDGQRDYLKLSSESTYSVAKNSDHYIYRGEPEVAVRAIERVAGAGCHGHGHGHGHGKSKG